MGARGNSGVILSQILRGLAEHLTEKESFTSADLAEALQESSAMAYKGISNPVEGTMLTVIKDVAVVAKTDAGAGGKDLIGLMEVVVQEAKESVERTPELLDVLKEAGVVDAGGQGLYIILEGILYYLREEADRIELMKIESPSTLQPALIAARSAETSMSMKSILLSRK